MELTPRERDVLLLLRMGKTNKEIASDLDLSINTVKTHTKNLFAKLGAQNRTQATLKSYDIL
ncbi:MAG: response regulator transcription factor [Flavobacteriales bacterium]|nr:response regulator transcription factor [Flavobacteriales bacterium]